MNDKKMIDCEEALKRLFEYIDLELNDHKHDEMEEHLSKCRSCYSRLEFEKKLQQHVKGVAEEKAPEQLHSKVRNLIRKL